MQSRAALFDLDGTLIDRDSGFVAWLDRIVDRHRLPPADRVQIQVLDRRFRQRDEFFAAAVARFPFLGDADRLWAEYRQLMPTLVAAYPGVLSADQVRWWSRSPRRRST